MLESKGTAHAPSLNKVHNRGKEGARDRGSSRLQKLVAGQGGSWLELLGRALRLTPGPAFLNHMRDAGKTGFQTSRNDPSSVCTLNALLNRGYKGPPDESEELASSRGVKLGGGLSMEGDLRHWLGGAGRARAAQPGRTDAVRSWSFC